MHLYLRTELFLHIIVLVAFFFFKTSKYQYWFCTNSSNIKKSHCNKPYYLYTFLKFTLLYMKLVSVFCSIFVATKYLTLNIRARWFECFSAFQGGLAQAISITTQPTLHTSQLLPYCWPLRTWRDRQTKAQIIHFKVS